MLWPIQISPSWLESASDQKTMSALLDWMVEKLASVAWTFVVVTLSTSIHCLALNKIELPAPVVIKSTPWSIVIAFAERVIAPVVVTSLNSLMLLLALATPGSFPKTKPPASIPRYR